MSADPQNEDVLHRENPWLIGFQILRATAVLFAIAGLLLYTSCTPFDTDWLEGIPNSISCLWTFAFSATITLIISIPIQELQKHKYTSK